MESSFLTILPNLGIGVVSVLALVYTVQKFLDHLDKKDIAFRSLEKEVRESIMSQLNKNTQAFERVLDHLNHE